MRPLLAAFVLLVGITSSEAADCTAVKFQGSVPTCDCPIGSGPTGSLGSRALPVKAGNGYGGAANALVGSLTKANEALAFCSDLLPGYKLAATVKTLPVLCIKTDGYCPGFAGAFPGTDSLVTTGSDTVGFSAVLIERNYVIPAGTSFAKSTVGVACPSNTVVGDTGPFTLDKCIVKDGFYLKQAPGVAQAVVADCPIKKVCPTGIHAAADIATVAAPVDCVGNGGNSVDVDGSFFCPVKTYGTLGTTLAASKAALKGLVICGAGSGVKADEATCSPVVGYYGAPETVGYGTVKTTAAATACPTGITGVKDQTTLALACTSIKAGYTVLAAIPKLTVPGPVTALTAGITACPVDKFCVGEVNKVALVGLSASHATYGAVAKGDGPAADCPLGTGNSVTGASAQGVNAISAGSACIDVLPNYAFKPSVGAADNVITAILLKCKGGEYGCAGKAGFLLDYDLAANTLVAGTGLTATDVRVKVGATKFEANTATAAAGTMIKASCKAGSANTAAGDTIASCLLKPGYYIDESDLNTPKLCPDSLYCSGGGATGTAGGADHCPSGSSLRGLTATDDDARNLENSNIKDCILDKGFYIAAANVNLPVPCPAGFACGGGPAVGTAGGSVICPTGSTNAECVTSSAVTTVNLTPASQPITVTSAPAAAAAAASPDVTVNVPSASSASSNVASFVVLTVAAIVAL